MKSEKTLFMHLASLVVLIAVFAFNTFPGIIKGNTAFTYDNGRDMLATYKIIFDHDLTLIGPTTGIPGVFHGAWWYYFLTIPFIISQGDPVFTVLAISIVGLCGLIVLYWLIAKIFNQPLALLISSLYATSPEILGRFVQIGHNNLEVPLGAFALFALFQHSVLSDGIKKNLYLGLFGIISGLIFELEFAYGLFILIFNLIFTIIIAKNNFKRLLFFFCGVIMPLVLRILFELRNRFLMTRTLINFFLHPQNKMYEGGVVDRFFNRINIFFNFWRGLFFQENPIVAILILLITLAGIILFIKQRRNVPPVSKTLFSWAFFSVIFLFICFLYYQDVIWGNYLNGIMIYFLFLIAISFNIVSKTFPKRTILFFGVSFFIIALDLFDNFFKLKIDWPGDYSVMKNQNQIMKLIDNDSAGKRNFGLGIYTASGYSYYYDYYYLRQENFLNIKRPQSLWKAKINYIIIEPDKRKILLNTWKDKYIDKKAKLIKKWQVVDVQIEKWQLN